MSSYGSVTIRTRDTSALDPNSPACDAHASFQALATTGRPILIEIGQAPFRGKRKARYHREDSPGMNRAENHFQGMARHGDTLYLTGADWDEPAAHLFVCALDTDAGGAPTGARLESVLALDTELPHAGGVQRLGDVLVVALEGPARDSRVRFLHLEDPARPTFVGGHSEIVRTGQTKASAGAVARMADGRLLVGVAWRNALDLYLTRDADLRNGYVPAGGAPAPRTLDLGPTHGKPAYQAIAFLPPEEWARADGGAREVRLPVVGFRNTSQALSNWWRGEDHADLFELIIPGQALDAWPGGPEILIRPITSSAFDFGRFDGNFSAAAGLDVEAGGALAIYAAHHWRTGEGIRFSVCGGG
ncbi:MAG: hypothetical protein WEA24_13495 [Gemmatimonadota bacterium]